MLLKNMHIYFRSVYLKKETLNQIDAPHYAIK